MTDERIDAIVAEFRDWLRTLPEDPAPAPPAEVLSMHALAAQFTALRHDVNMQTKAARAAVEQSSAVLKQLQESTVVEEEGDERLEPKPIVKLVLDLHDALGIAHRQLDKAVRTVESPPPAPGFLARLFGPAPPADDAKLRERLAGAADGYAMSLRRLERGLADLGLEAIPARDLPFDPECMEAVDTAPAGDRPPGTVVEVVRHGYRRHGAIVRHAQVRVAK